MDVDVIVTDREGHPVSGLSREDFRIRVDKKSVDIDYFAAVRGGGVREPDLHTLSPDLVVNPEEKGKESRVPRHFLLFVDEASLTPSRRRKAIEALRDFVTRFDPSDEAILVAERSRPIPLTDWTSRRETLLAAIDGISQSAVAGLRRAERERQAMHEIRMVGRVGAQEERARMYEEEVYEETKKTLADMTSTLALLADKPGKKIFLDISEGFELQPGAALLNFAGRGGSSSLSFRRDVTPELQRFIDRANALETTVFTINARGLPGSTADASNEVPLYTTSLTARQDMQAALAEMAEQTGGEAILQTNDLVGALSAVYRDASSYYSLGVNLRNVTATESHRVEVAVDRPGLIVRARRTYTVEGEEQRFEDRVRATLLTAASYADLAASLKTGAPVREGRVFTLPVEVEVPARDLTFLPDGGHVTARPVYYFAALNDRGEETPLTRTTQAFTLSPPEARGARPLVLRLSLKLRKGEYVLVANVLDPETGRMGTARANVRVSDARSDPSALRPHRLGPLENSGGGACRGRAPRPGARVRPISQSISASARRVAGSDPSRP
jgi:VWFA-related protein